MPEAGSVRAARPELAWYWRELQIAIAAPLLAAWFFSTLFREPFYSTLVYALCIGLLIQVLIEGGRFGLSYRLRRRSPEHAGAQQNWPGWHVMAPLVVLASVGAFFPGHALGDIILGVHRPAGGFFHRPPAFKLILAIMLLISASFTYFLYMRGRLAMLSARSEAANRSAAENQLRLLQSQLEPHMLFNTLANLRVMIGIDAAQAQAMLDHLSAFLRAMLEASRTGTHALEAEFARIDEYLQLMQIRMGPRLQSRLDLPPELARLAVPPLLLQPLVENAIKHGLEPQVVTGTIVVAARREGNALVLTVSDTGVGPCAIVATGAGFGFGFGLQHVRERLAALYGNSASFVLAAAADGTVATVRLPISPESKP